LVSPTRRRQAARFVSGRHRSEDFMELIHTCYRITDPDRSVAF
jgi:hypothetical protein